MRGRIVPSLFALSLVVAACNGDDEADTTTTSDASTTTVDSTTTSTIVEQTTTTTETTTTTSTTTTSTTTTTTTTTVAPTTVAPTAPPTTCPVGPSLPAGASSLTGLAADLNGDGQPDSLQTYAIPATTEWHVRVEWGGGGSTDAIVAGVGGAGASQPIGAFDVEGDGTPEIFLTVGAGASAVLVGLYDVAGCALTRITVGAEPAVFPIGATVGNVSGLSCGPVGHLDRLFASFVGGDEWEGGFEPFNLSGSVLTAGFGDGGTFTTAEANALADLDCGTLTLP